MGGTRDPTAQSLERRLGRKTETSLGWREGVEVHAVVHARLRRAEDEGGRGKGSHTTYCERLKGATVLKC